MNLELLIQETYNKCNEIEDYPTTLLKILKEKHYWPQIKIKKFQNNKNLCLLHNSYKSNNTEGFKELYDECRSIILDFSRSIGNNVVISYANSIPKRVLLKDYINNNYEPSDKCYSGMDGTLITIYYHNDNWNIGTSCCPDINNSKFSNAVKTHGYMFYEVLYEIYKGNVDVFDPNITKILKELFTANLSKLYSYEFVLIHHENKHIIDYSEILGENYKYLYHINTKNRLNLKEEDISSEPLKYLNIKYPYEFKTLEEAINYVEMGKGSLIIKKNNNKLLKVSNERIYHQEEVHSNNYNKWYNFIYVYMLQKNGYTIKNYIEEFYEELEEKEKIENEISQIFITMTDIIYNLYIITTNYYPKYKRFKTNLNIDRTLSPVLRFHLAQLRHQQTTIYSKAIITKKEVLNYLCHSNNIKNIKKIILHISSTLIYDIPEDIIEIFKKININLSN